MEKIDKTRELVEKNIGSLLFTYALPAVITQVIASIYNIADRIFIGQGVGALAIAGLAITMPIMNIIHAFGSLVGVGASARLSIVLGKKDLHWAENIVGNSMLLTVFFGVLFMSAWYAFGNVILSLFGATPDTIAYAREYMNIVIPGMFLTTVTFNLTGLIRASGYPHKSMWIMVSGAVLNVILDALFIFVFKAGIAGAAWATTLSMGASAVWALSHFVQRSSFVRFRVHGWRPRLFIIRNILLIGMSPFFMNVAASAVVALLNSQLIQYGGDLAVGAYGICNTYASVMIMFILGVCQGMQPIAGYNYGAGRPDRLKRVYLLTMKWNVFFGCVGCFMGVALPQYLMHAFTSDAQLIENSAHACRYIMVMFPLIGFTITNSHFFQSIDKPWIAIVTSLSRQVLFLAPLSLLFPVVLTGMGYSGLTGIWLSCTASDVLGAVLAAVLFMSQRKVFDPKQ